MFIGILRNLDAAVFDPLRQEVVKALEKEIVPCCKTLLDIGCGESSPIRGFSSRLEYSMGIDAFEPALATSRGAGIHTEYRKMDLLDIGQFFPPQSFDCVLALDVIEHLPKDQGHFFLESMEKIAKKKVIVFTPNGFVPQGDYDDNPWQVHLSGWDVTEMEEKGYQVLGMNGWKALWRGSPAEWKPGFLRERLILLTQVLTYKLPNTAFQLLCIKDKTA